MGYPFDDWDWDLHDPRDPYDIDFELSGRDRFGDTYDYDFDYPECGRDFYLSDESEDALSPPPRHASQSVGLEELAELSGAEGKYLMYRLGTRAFRNWREYKKRSMDRQKWKRELGPRRNRRFFRDRHGDMLDGAIWWANELIKEDRQVRAVHGPYLPRTESDAVVCGASDRYPDDIWDVVSFFQLIH